MSVRLCDEDRDRFGLAEWIEWDPMDITVVDLTELAERFAFDPTDWPEPYTGSVTLEQAGNPDAKPVQPRWAMHAAAWMILRQNGVDASWDDAGTLRLAKAHFRRSGKGQDPSTDSDTSTTPRSASSSISPKRKSAA